MRAASMLGHVHLPLVICACHPRLCQPFRYWRRLRAASPRWVTLVQRGGCILFPQRCNLHSIAGMPAELSQWVMFRMDAFVSIASRRSNET
jgi:hypothetical protein